MNSPRHEESRERRQYRYGNVFLSSKCKSGCPSLCPRGLKKKTKHERFVKLGDYYISFLSQMSNMRFS